METTDYRSPAGKDREPTKEKVGVVHLTCKRGNSGTFGGAIAGAVDSISKTIQSAKNALWGGKGRSNNI